MDSDLCRVTKRNTGNKHTLLFPILDIDVPALKHRFRTVSRPAYFKTDGPMMEIEMWRPWRQCISPKCLMSHLYPNGPSTECPKSVTTVTYAYRVVGILRDDKQRRNRCYRKSNCKSFSLGKSRLEFRTKSQSV